MKIEVFPHERGSEVRGFVLGVLAGEGFEYDPGKDFDLDDICGYYIDSGGLFFIGTVDGKVIGTGAVRRIDGDTCEIKRIYVKKEFRGRGYGSGLFRAAIDFARTNYRNITLKTDRSLDSAINMYLKYGFSVIREEGDTLFFGLGV